MKENSVSFIGAGNLAWHLAPALDNAGYAVREVFSRNEKNANAVAERLYECEVVSDPDFSQSPSTIFVLAVSDDAIPEVLESLVLPEDAILVHTSGSQPLSVLNDFPVRDTGVFYPLQTFSKGRKVDLERVPIFVESANDTVIRTLTAMGKAISRTVITISSEERKALHVAAVFASNFTNHMLTIAQQIMRGHNMKYELLKPLIAETLNKSLELGPVAAQTGPARRGDLQILDAHMEFLADDAELAEIYKNVSQHIIDSY